MRLQTLDLIRFGHFTDRRFDFGAKPEGADFHIIYGRNEAGKTTTMEGLLRLLYGFRPRNEPYEFRHQRANLRVGATMEIAGVVRSFVRIASGRATLLDGNGAVLPETALSQCLGGLTESDYRNLLCLDDATIERGGEEIVQARGDTGRLLFAAAAGLSDLSHILDTLRREADAIWAGRTTTTVIAKLRQELKVLDEEIRRHEVSANEWTTRRKAAAAAAATEAVALARRRDLLRHKGALEARLRALPMLDIIAGLDRRIAALPSCPERLGFDPDELNDLQADARSAGDAIERLEEEIAEADARREALAAIPAAPGLDAALAALAELHAVDTGAVRQSAVLGREIESAEAELRRASERLGLSAAVAADAPDVPSAAVMNELSDARDRLLAARLPLPAALSEVEALDRRRSAIRDTLGADQAASARPEDGIAALLARYDLDRLAPLHATARQILREAETQAQTRLAALSHAGTAVAALPKCRHSAARAQALADEHDSCTEQAGHIADLIEQAGIDSAARAARIEHLAATHAVLRDAEAEQLRDERDRLWREHRAAPDEESARAFESALGRHDAAMAARLSQASALGEIRALEREQAGVDAGVAERRRLLAERQDQLARLAGEIEAAASASGLDGTTLLPAEWAGWVRAHDEARAALLALDQARTGQREILDKAEALRVALAPLLGLEAPDFETAIEAARPRAQVERAAAQERVALQQELDRLDQDAVRRSAGIATLHAAIDAASVAWHGALAALSWPIEAQLLLDSLEPLRRFQEAAVRLRQARDRIAELERDRRQFADSVTALALRFEVAEGADAAATHAALSARHAAATQAATELSTLTDRIEAARRALAQQQAIRLRVEDRRRALAALVAPQTADCGIDSLRQATRAALDVIAARQDRSERIATMLRDLDAPDLEAASALLAGASATSLRAELDAVGHELGELETRLPQATEARYAAAAALGAIGGDDAAALLGERRATVLLALEEAALDHLALSLGHRLASDAIGRYRHAHRSEMMQATERAFRTLTGGAYHGIVAERDGEAEVLRAVDATGVSKQVASLSKGTRFQLFLALRTAAYERLCAEGVSLPFLCDDIFETFDEDRTRAACRMMEQVGRSGQAIYLTHHRHVVEIAVASCERPPTVHCIE